MEGNAADYLTFAQLRVLLSRTGELTVEASPTPPVTLEDLFPRRLRDRPPSIPCFETWGTIFLEPYDQANNKPANAMSSGPWRVYLDTVPTTPTSFTKYKTTSRDAYNSARARAGITSYQEPAEVLLINPRGEIMEGSMTNVYFFRQGRWVTPRAEAGGHEGTAQKGLHGSVHRCFEDVRADSIIEGEECYLSNGVRGLIWGRICNSSSQSIASLAQSSRWKRV